MQSKLWLNYQVWAISGWPELMDTDTLVNPKRSTGYIKQFQFEIIIGLQTWEFRLIQVSYMGSEF